MKEVISNLKRAGVTVLACCCGHGKYHKSIVVRTVFNGNVEYFAGAKIPRKKRFYVRDAKGVFFIPEAEQKYLS